MKKIYACWVKILSLGLLIPLPVAVQANTNDFTYYVNDAVGSPVVAMNQAGDVIWRKTYEPYGKSHGKDGDNRIGYTGHVEDKPDLVYAGARYYDPDLVRFLSDDPVRFAESNPMSFNRYAYANNNPYKYVDPDGRWSTKGHDSLYLSAFDGVLTPAEIKIIQIESAIIDRSTQGTSDSYKHAMRKSFQSADSAKKATDEYISDRLLRAGSKTNRVEALKEFAAAAHAITDRLSPEHTNADGSPKLWSVFLAEGHSPNDHVGNETSKDITPEIRQKATEDLIKAYSQTF